MSARAVIAALAVASAVSLAAAEQQAPTFSSRVEAVRVDVLVTDKGQPVRGLQAADFDVLDNGVRQQVDLATSEQIPLDIIMALDMSDSVFGERLSHLQDAGRMLLGALKGGDRVGLVTFSQMVLVRAQITADSSRVRAALDRARPLGGTSLVDGCLAGIVLGETEVGRQLLIVFSDGLDTTSWMNADAVLDTARRSDVVVYAVLAGASRQERPGFLRDLGRLTGGSVFEVESTKDLGTTFLRVLEEFRNRYVLSYSPRGVAAGGWHRLDVRVRGRSVTVRARPGYDAGR